MAYAQPTSFITDALHRLRRHIDDVPTRLQILSAAELTQHTPGKWSRKEILGHLIDSALNNLKRFTDAQFADGIYSIHPYNQNKLVVVNHYQALPLTHLLTLWCSLNMQIVYVAESIPAASLNQPVLIGPVINPEQTLCWVIEDYVAHLEHHLTTLY